MKKHFIIKMAIMVVFILAGLQIKSQPINAPSFKLELKNDVQVSANEYEFDVCITNTEHQFNLELELVKIQLGIRVNDAIRNGGEFSASIVQNSNVAISSIQRQTNANVFINKSIPDQTIKVTIASNPVKTGTLISKSSGTRIMRIRITNSVPFAQAKPNLSRSFTGPPSWSTIVIANINGSTYVINDYGTFGIAALNNPTLNSSSLVFKSLITKPTESIDDNISLYFFDKTIYLKNPDLVKVNQIEVYNILGRKVAFIDPNKISNTGYKLDLAAGNYIIKVCISPQNNQT